jgi:hypothetical protein
MSILPIQTKFTGISRPQKVSFATFDEVIPPQDEEFCIIPGYFESGTVILGATINRADGSPFINNEQIALAATDTLGSFDNFKQLVQVGVLNGELFQINLEGIGISFPYPFFLIATGITPPDTNYRFTVEYYSESGPSLN